jgi:hypothetical protein
VVLEEDQVYETEANRYIRSELGEIPLGLCLRANLLQELRRLNQSLPEDENIQVHLCDVDSPLAAIHAHLQNLQQDLRHLGEGLVIPLLREFSVWSKEDSVRLVDQLARRCQGRELLEAQISTVKSSVEFYSEGARIGIGTPVGDPTSSVREACLTNNILKTFSRIGRKPLLAFLGWHHVQKRLTYEVPDPRLKGVVAQELISSGLKTFALGILGASGETNWRSGKFQLHSDMTTTQLPRGETLEEAWTRKPNCRIAYFDLRGNTSLRLNHISKNIPAREVFDAVVIFREFTPIEEHCPAKLNTPEKVEEFLRGASIVTGFSVSSEPIQVIIEDNLQCKSGCFRSHRVDPNFFEYAAYEVAKMLGLRNVPATVLRTVQDVPGSLQLWVNRAIPVKAWLDRGYQLPVNLEWHPQVQAMHIFDNLIYNRGRNDLNLLKTMGPEFFWVSYANAFHSKNELFDIDIITNYPPDLLQKLKQLDQEWVVERLGSILSKRQIEALMTRRDLLLVHAERLLRKQNQPEAFGTAD